MRSLFIGLASIVMIFSNIGSADATIAPKNMHTDSVSRP